MHTVDFHHHGPWHSHDELETNTQALLIYSDSLVPLVPAGSKIFSDLFFNTDRSIDLIYWVKATNMFK